MTLKERRVGDVTILDLKGRLVLDDGDDLFRDRVTKLSDEGRLNVLVNLKEVTYVDSCGVGVLIAKYVSLQRKGGSLKLVNLTRRSQRLIEISKLFTVFEPFDSEEAAVASFSREAKA